MNKSLWKPSDKRIRDSLLDEFCKFIKINNNKNFKEIWKWSIDNPKLFWSKFWDYSKIIGQKGEEIIRSKFNKSNIIRIDSDSTRKKGQIEKIFNDIKNNKYDILIGTQMLSKGHNFPNITLVIVMNIDQSLFSPRLKAIEQLAQQLVQVSGRSGRGGKKGEVILQTSFPDNEDLKCLIDHGYEKWMNNLLLLRNNLGLPPHKNWGVVQAKARKYIDAENFLNSIKKIIKKDNQIEIFGPMPSNMQKKANLYNLNLVIQAKNKMKLN